MLKNKRKKQKYQKDEEKKKFTPFIHLEAWEKVLVDKNYKSIMQYLNKFFSKKKQLRNAIDSFEAMGKNQRMLECCYETISILAENDNYENKFFFKEIFKSKKFLKLTEQELMNSVQQNSGNYIICHLRNKNQINFDKLLDSIDLLIEQKFQEKEILEILNLFKTTEKFQQQQQKLDNLIEKFELISENNEIIEEGENQKVQTQQIDEFNRNLQELSEALNLVLQKPQVSQQEVQNSSDSLQTKLFNQKKNQRKKETNNSQVDVIKFQKNNFQKNSFTYENGQRIRVKQREEINYITVQERHEAINKKYRKERLGRQSESSIQDTQNLQQQNMKNQQEFNIFKVPKVYNHSRIQYYNEKDCITYHSCSAEPSIIELNQVNQQNAHLTYGGQLLELEKLNYYSAEQFINNHFFILREDFMLGFRKAIASLKKNKFSQIDQVVRDNVYLYTNVMFVGLSVTNKGLIYQIELNVVGAHQSKIEWSRTKRLQSGSLLVIADTDFKYIIFSKIIDVPKVQMGKIRVSISIIQTSLKIQVNYINALLSSGKNVVAIQNKVIFESYIYYLKGLQNLNYVDLPFKNFLLKNQRLNIPFAEHLIRNSLEFYNKFQKIDQLISQYGSTLDQSQIHAVKQIVTKSLALIQGPPGTGKTFCGALAVRILLCLREQEHVDEFNRIGYSFLQQMPNQSPQKPILIICQTNHAIDQFLNHIIEFCPQQNIIRLGCRSKEPKFETISLVHHQKNRKMRFEWSDFYKLKQKVAKGLQNKFIFYNLGLEDFQKYAPQILNMIVKQYCGGENLQFCFPISFGTTQIILKTWKNNNQLNDELRNKIILNEQHAGNKLRENENQAKNNNFNILNQEKQFIQQEKQLNKIEIDQQQYFDSDIEQDSQSDDEENIQSQTNNQAENDQNFLDEQQRPQIQLLDLYDLDIYDIDQYDIDLNKDLNFYQLTKLIGNQDLKVWKMKTEEKSILMGYIFYQKSNHNYYKIDDRLSKYESKLHEIKQMSDSLDVDIIKSKQIVAATLNGCAKHLDILKQIGFETLIIEEAGEVLESHLLANFYSSLNHLILIGDHQQLQPHLQCYELEQKYHTNISMFERFINNRLEYVTLQYQRRMKSKFADFIRLIYTNYYDHENIKQQNSIKIDCLNDDLIFFDHQQLEKVDDQSKSKSNIFEADMIVQLIQYLLLNKIQEKNITILTTYKRQSQIIKNKMKNKIKVSTVDDYQGDENDIIILSLVRSNKNKKLGYVSIENRICVAFSRARLALIVFGNFSFIQDATEYKLQKKARQNESSGLWLKIIELAQQKQVLKDYIDLSCPIHQTNTKIKQLNDWAFVKYGGCKEICNQLFPCRHICKKQCHKEAHLQSDCQEIVQKNLSCGHIQTVRCGLQYITCVALVTQILQCGHQSQIKCFEKDQKQLCKNKCERNLYCGHQCQGLCYQNCHEIKCLEQVTISLNCYHKKKIKCYESQQLDLVICEELCETKLECGHKCTGMCGVCSLDLHSPCLQIHEEKLECDHKVMKTLQDCTKCNNDCNYVCNCNTQCKLKCDQQCFKCQNQCQLQCKHSKCHNKCFEICDREACNFRCDKILPCRCQCIGLCGEQCPLVCSIQSHQTIFFQKQAKLYQLECKQKCIFIVNDLDYWMNNQPKSSLIRCQSCKSIIWSSSRYQKIIKESLSNFNRQKNLNLIDQNINEEKLVLLQKQVQIQLEYLKWNKLKDSNNFLHNIDLLIKNQIKNAKKDNQFTLRWKQYKSIEYQLKLYQTSRNLEQLQQQNHQINREYYIIIKYYSLNEEFQQNYSKVFWESISKKLTNHRYYRFNSIIQQQ